MNNAKLNVYKQILQKVCEKFNGAEDFIKEKLKSSAVMENYQWIEVTYLFINDYDNF